MAVGRISGPLLKDNLLRNGVNLAFETNLLYLDVVNSRIGVNTQTPTYDLDVNGTTRSVNLYATTQANLATFTVTGNTISSSSNTINLTPNGVNPTVFSGTINVGNLALTTNTLSSSNTNGAINITANGTGAINLNSNVLITGNLHATGNITADGNIQFGDMPTDTISFAGEVNSNILQSNPVSTLAGALISGANPGILTFASSTGSAIQAGMLLSGGGVTAGTYIVSGSGTTWTLNQAATGTPTTASSTFNLGSNTLQWNNVYVTTANVTNYNISTFTASSITTTGTPSLTISGNTITANGTNADINFSTSGTGGVLLGNFKFYNNTITNTIANSITQLSESTYSWTAGIAPGAAATLVAGAISGTTLTFTSSSGATVTAGMVLSGGSVIAGTYIVSGSGLTWTVSLSQSATCTTATPIVMTVSAVTVGILAVGVYITSGAAVNTVITATNSQNAALTGTGAAGTYLVSPSQTVSASTAMTGVGAGYFKITGTYGVVLPSGTTITRPQLAYTEAGMIRFNSDLQLVEVYTGLSWTSIAGTGAGVTSATAQDIGVQTALALG